MNMLLMTVGKDYEVLNDLRSSQTERRRKAENRFFNAYQYFVREAARKYGISEDKLSDVYSDSVMAALESIQDSRFKERCSLKTYLYQIFRFKCVDFLRRTKSNKSIVHQTVSIDELQLHIFDNTRTILEELIQKSERELINEHLTKLCHRSQRILQLSAEGYSDEEIAMQLKFKTGKVVKTSRLRCIKKLRMLNDYKMQKTA